MGTKTVTSIKLLVVASATLLLLLSTSLSAQAQSLGQTHHFQHTANSVQCAAACSSSPTSARVSERFSPSVNLEVNHVRRSQEPFSTQESKPWHQEAKEVRTDYLPDKTDVFKLAASYLL